MTQLALHLAEAVSDYLAEPSRADVRNLIPLSAPFDVVNERLRHLTGIRRFFPDAVALAEFERVLQSPQEGNRAQARQWGDFQTPPRLAAQVCGCLADLDLSPDIVVEPTYGVGNFITAALRAFPQARLVYGVEIQDKYEWQFKIALLEQALHGRRPTAELDLHQDDIFTHKFSPEVLNAQNILILGNPPWVTNAALRVLDSGNLPVKSNIKALTGLDARTGKSNFDLGEYILLRLLALFAAQRGTLALLCKSSVIKSLVEMLPRWRLPVSNIRAYGIDAAREFGAAVEASLLVIDLGQPHPTFLCTVASLDNPQQAAHTFGWVRNKFVSHIDDYRTISALDGESLFVWRQGLKHDCAKIMEMDVAGEVLVNGNGDVVDVEDRWVYWLLKSSDLKGIELDQARKKVLVTQQHIGEDTTALRILAPRLWQYLEKHRRFLDTRKSSIYQGKPPFSIFGIGPYSFKPYKVAVSGLYKELRFVVVRPIDNQPVMLDDTCYFLGFDTYLDALLTASLLNSLPTRQFLRSIVFEEAKRPYTKEILMRINLVAVANQVDWQELHTAWDAAGYRPRTLVLESDFEDYKRRVLQPNNAKASVQLSLGL